MNTFNTIKKSSPLPIFDEDEEYLQGFYNISFDKESDLDSKNVEYLQSLHVTIPNRQDVEDYLLGSYHISHARSPNPPSSLTLHVMTGY